MMRAASLRVRAAAGSVLFPLYAAGFVTAFGAHAVAANLGSYALGHRTSLLELGVLLAVYDGAEVVLKPVFGTLADRVGPKPVLIGGLIGFAVASAGFVAADEPGLLGAARLAQGAAAAAFSPAAGALVASAGGRTRPGRSFGGYGAAKSLGYLAGPVLGGGLVLAGGYRLLFGILATLAVAVTALAWSRVPAADPQPRPRETVTGLARRLGDPSFLRPVGLLAAATAATSAAVGYLPVSAARAELTPLVGGAVVSGLAAVAVVVELRGRPSPRRRTPRPRQRRRGADPRRRRLRRRRHPPRSPDPGRCRRSDRDRRRPGHPIGFAAVAAAAPSGRLGQTIGAAEVGRELGDAGGPMVVAALTPFGLGAGLAGLAGILTLTAALIRPPLQADRNAHTPPRCPDG